MIDSISWVLPLFNEAEYVKIAIPTTVSLMNSLGVDYEIIIVDDASNDESAKLIHEFAQDNKKIRVLRHEQNRGLGASLRTGLNSATKDIIIYTDIDLPFDFSLLKDILPLIKEADIVHGYRIGSRESIKRILYSKIYNFLIRKIFGLDIKDVNFSLDIIRRDIINQLNLKSEASFIAAELLTKAYYSKYKITQVPVHYTPRIYGVSHLSSLRNIFKIISELIRYYPEISALKLVKTDIKNVIINADDFALCGGTNKGIIMSFREGVVTSASILATGQAFSEAVYLAKNNKDMGIGIHLCLTQEVPVLGSANVPSLIDKNGHFYSNWNTLLARTITGKINFTEVKNELEAQIVKVLDSGIIPTHIDSHQYIHLFPKISAIVASLADKYHIKNIRYPKEGWGIMPMSLSIFCRKILLLLSLHYSKNDFKKYNLNHTDNFIGLSLSGKLNTLSLKSYIKKVRPGITEIVCHPGADMYGNIYKHWGYRWEEELDALRDEEVKLLIKTSGIKLVNYKILNEE